MESSNGKYHKSIRAMDVDFCGSFEVYHVSRSDGWEVVQIFIRNVHHRTKSLLLPPTFY
jgi:hypothetical protein